MRDYFKTVTLNAERFIPNLKNFDGLTAYAAAFSDGEVSDCCDLTETEFGYEIKRTVVNYSPSPVRLRELLFRIDGFSFGENTQAIDDYYYVNENARLFCTLTLPVDFDRTYPENAENAKFGVTTSRRWTDVDILSDRICSCPYQPFPAILISNYKSKTGVVVGSLSQNCFYHNFRTGHGDCGKVFLEIYSSFKGVESRVLEPGETLIDEWFIGVNERADDINGIFAPYTYALRKRLKNCVGASETNRHSLIWDSWNDGIYRDVSESMLLAEARAVKRFFPTVEWFQLDDGYSAYCEKNVDLDAHGIGVVFEGEDGIDKIKFPQGLKHYVEEIKKIGLRPAVWIGGFCPVKSEIYRKHPGWFIDLSYRVKFSQPLDPSVSKAREYMTRALDEFIGEYGFEGIKLDFWTYAFEDKHDLLRYDGKSGYEWRTWWQREIRKRLPAYGYVETGCDIGMGNPFLGKYFNNYRYGLDVGSGKWDNIKTVMFWTVAMLSLQTGDLFIPNSDSAGLLPGLDDADFDFVLNFQIITRTLVEISGRFSCVDGNNRRLKRLMRAAKYPNNGENVFFVGYDYRKSGELLPEIVYINSAFDAPDDSFKTVAIFNPTEAEKKISFSNADIGVDGAREIENVWTGEKTFSGGVTALLAAHGSALYKIKKD